MCIRDRSWGLDVEMLDRAELARLAPYLSESVIAAAFCPIEGKADTRTAAPALAPVSYTHLDVYKRQRYRLSRAAKRSRLERIVRC